MVQVTQKLKDALYRGLMSYRARLLAMDAAGEEMTPDEAEYVRKYLKKGQPEA